MTAQMTIVQSDEIAALLDEVRALRQAVERVDMTPRKDWLTIAEYARWVGRSEHTVRRYIAAGKVETKRAGGVRLIRR